MVVHIQLSRASSGHCKNEAPGRAWSRLLRRRIIKFIHKHMGVYVKRSYQFPAIALQLTAEHEDGGAASETVQTIAIPLLHPADAEFSF